MENDRWLFGVPVALCLLGAVMIFSASAVTAEQQYGHSYIFLARQAAWLFIGLLGMFALMEADYRRLREPAAIYRVVCVVLLLLVGTFFLDKSHATHRWIRFGPVGIQPSELAKLATILYLAWFMDQRRRNKASMEFCREDFWRTIFPAAGPILVYVVLILLQPDLGTSIDILVVAAAILFVAVLSWEWLAVGLARAIPVVYLLITHGAYRQARLMAFLHPDSDPQGAGFQLLQSLKSRAWWIGIRVKKSHQSSLPVGHVSDEQIHHGNRTGQADREPLPRKTGNEQNGGGPQQNIDGRP